MLDEHPRGHLTQVMQQLDHVYLPGLSTGIGLLTETVIAAVTVAAAAAGGETPLHPTPTPRSQRRIFTSPPAATQVRRMQSR